MGNVDISGLKEFTQKLEKQLSPVQMDEFIGSCAKELAARVLRGAIKRTPVGQYPSESGKVGGTLRRGWKVSEVKSFGYDHVIEVFNPVEYAPFVEYGHRQEPGRYVPAIGKRLKASWVEGHFMMTQSEKEVQVIAPRLVEARFKRKLGEIFNGQ